MREYTTLRQLALGMAHAVDAGLPASELRRLAGEVRRLAEDPPPAKITFAGTVAGDDLDPYVVMAWGELEGRMTPKEAEEHACGVLRAVEAAYTDSFMVRFLVERGGLSSSQMAAILTDYRRFRGGLDRR